jgi:hypothetical protein
MLTAGLFAFGATAVTAGPAQAAYLDCGVRAPDIDHGSYHTAVVSGGAYQHNGPHDRCAIVGWTYINDRLDYYCYTRNAAGNTWTLLRNTATNAVGWIYDGNLTDGGSYNVCQGGEP